MPSDGRIRAGDRDKHFNMGVEPGTGHVKPAARFVRIDAGGVTLDGDWHVPPGATGMVLFAHGSGSSRHSPRNQQVARTLRESGIGTLLFDLLSREEEALEAETGNLRFDIDLLSERLVAATRWVARQPDGDHLGFGYFGASTGGAAALVAAAELGPAVDAVVVRGGRPDLANHCLPRVEAATLLLVGERDDAVLQMNRDAFAKLRCRKKLSIVPRAGHLFEEPGALEEVARQAVAWFGRYLKAR